MQTFTKEEVSIIWNSLNVNSKGEARTFPLAQLKDASEIVASVKAKCVNDKDAFIDGEMEFSTDQKKLIRDCSDKEWVSQVGLAVLSLREKLA